MRGVIIIAEFIRIGCDSPVIGRPIGSEFCRCGEDVIFIKELADAKA